MTDKPEEPERPSPEGDEEKEKKEPRSLGALRNIFGRMAFEKGPAYQDEPRKDEQDLGSREGLRRNTRRRSRTSRKPPDPDKPPEAFPGP